ncbi:MAG: serine/threonine protein kinase [Bifidobacteriaceae bacterium]|jgi:serine/threonine protein kinase|nr:serine/threonine protein kinase [Bifidobacteriaceae bacterium]
MPPTRPPAPPPAIDGFEPVKLIGQGTFADVFLYNQAVPKRQVAVKVLLPYLLAEGGIDRVKNQAHAIAELSTHPNIVTIHTTGFLADGRLYVVMEYCPKPSIAQTATGRGLPVLEAIAVGVQLAGALETAHRQGVVHRGVRPSNILITPYGRHALTDFAMPTAADGAKADQPTPALPFEPPEALTRPWWEGPQLDVWGLGATLYYLLTGRAPFQLADGDNGPAAMADRIEHADLPPLGLPTAPDALYQVLATAMAKDTQARFPTAAAVGHSLRRVQQDLGLNPTRMVIHQDEPEQQLDDLDDEDQMTRLRAVTSSGPTGGVSTNASSSMVLTPWLTPTGSEPGPPAPAGGVPLPPTRQTAPSVPQPPPQVVQLRAQMAPAPVQGPPPGPGGPVQPGLAPLPPAAPQALPPQAPPPATHFPQPLTAPAALAAPAPPKRKTGLLVALIVGVLLALGGAAAIFFGLVKGGDNTASPGTTGTTATYGPDTVKQAYGDAPPASFRISGTSCFGTDEMCPEETDPEIVVHWISAKNATFQWREVDANGEALTDWTEGDNTDDAAAGRYAFQFGTGDIPDVLCVEVKEYDSEGQMLDGLEDALGDPRPGWWWACLDKSLELPNGASGVTHLYETHGEVTTDVNLLGPGQVLAYRVEYCDGDIAEQWCASYQGTGFATSLPAKFQVPVADLITGLEPEESAPASVTAIHGTYSRVIYWVIEGNRISPSWGNLFDASTMKFIY